MFKRLQNPWVLLSLFISTILLTLGFMWISQNWGMTFLDAISSPEQARAHIEALSPEQIRVHIWTTAIVDVLYPLAYGGFFIGVALASYRRFGLLLAIPSILVIPVDIAEGVVQIYALTGMGDWLASKAVLTPLKFLLFYMGFAVAIFAGLRWCYQKLLVSFLKPKP